MLKKLLDKFFPKKYVLINVRRGGYVGETYNLVPYKRTLTKSQNKKHLSVFYPWKHFPREYLKSFEKPASYLDTNDHQFETRMMANTYRSKWWATYKAKQILQKTDIKILAIGEIIKQDYLSYATLLPYYETKIVDLAVLPDIRWRIKLGRKYNSPNDPWSNRVYSVVGTPSSRVNTAYILTSKRGLKCKVFPDTKKCLPPKNYWLSHEFATKYMESIESLYPECYLGVGTRYCEPSPSGLRYLIRSSAD